MKYCLISEDWFFLKKKIDSILESLNKQFENIDIIRLPLSNFSTTDIKREIFTHSLFSEKRVFIIEEANFLSTEKSEYKGKIDDKHIEKFIKYDGDDIIIFTCVTKKIDSRKNLTKLMQKETQWIEVNVPSINERKKMLLKKLEENNIKYDIDAIDYLYLRLPDDISIFSKETNKIISSKEYVNLQYVYNITSKYIVFDFFELQDNFLSGNIEGFLTLYKSYLKSTNSAIGLIISVSKSLSITRKILLLKQYTKSNSEIASILKENPYRVNVLIKKNKFSINEINEVLFKINDLLWKCTNDISDQKIIPEVTFLEIMLNKKDCDLKGWRK